MVLLQQFNNLNDSKLNDLKENIQTGDPFLEKLLMEACCEISDLKLLEESRI